MKLNLLLFLFIVITASCLPVEQEEIVEGMAPVYSSFDDFSHIQSEGPRAIGTLGKIVNVDDYIFIVELFQGIHVIDNSNPSNPEYIHFWKIYGCSEFTIEGNTLYADNSKHLIVIDISDFSNILYVSHIPDFYEGNFAGAFRPPNYSGKFECVDSELGIVIGWETKTLINPLCTAF